MRASLILALPLLSLAACNSGAQETRGANSASRAKPFNVTEVARFNEPWAMTFVPGIGQALITEKSGKLKLWEPMGAMTDVAGVPRVAYGGQGGLGDVLLHPDFANNRYVYLSFVEAGQGGKGAAVGRGKLAIQGSKAAISGFQVIWRQSPKVSGDGHFGHRLAFSPNGQFLFITSGERQKFTPAQARNQNLGKIIRVTDTGGIPGDNPFYDQGGGAVLGGVWTLGHRNPLGLAFDGQGRLWEIEMGPKGGDEFNLIERGKNYGYPIVSDGDHYDGRNIPDHRTRPEFAAPKITWTPVISPAGLIHYTGAQFPAWRNSFLLGGLSGEALVRVTVNGNNARIADRWDMGTRIREVEQGPDGAVWLLEDGKSGRLMKLTPARPN